MMMFMETESGYRLALVGSGTTLLPHIDVESDTGYLIRALLECAPGKIVLGAGEMISWSEMLKVWCECNKVQFGGFDPLSVDQFERFIPVLGLGRELGEMFAFMDDFGYAGGDPDVVFPSEVYFHSSVRRPLITHSLESIVLSPVGRIGSRSRIGRIFSAVEEHSVKRNWSPRQVHIKKSWRVYF
jgi:hypothetical protein